VLEHRTRRHLQVHLHVQALLRFPLEPSRQIFPFGHGRVGREAHVDARAGGLIPPAVAERRNLRAQARLGNPDAEVDVEIDRRSRRRTAGTASKRYAAFQKSSIDSSDIDAARREGSKRQRKSTSCRRCPTASNRLK